MEIKMIAAKDRDDVIGHNGEIPWNYPKDFEHFKKTTMGHTLIMGRVTYETTPGLEGRNIIVLSKSVDSIDDVKVANSPEEALKLVDDEVVYICGGQKVYEEFMDKADELIISFIPERHPGDTHFPTIKLSEWRISGRVLHDNFKVVIYKRLQLMRE